MSKYKVKILKKIELRESEPDDYYRVVLFKCVLVGGKKKLKFDFYDSFDDNFCELTGEYTETVGVSVFEKDIEEITKLYHEDFQEYKRRMILSFFVSKSIIYRLFDKNRIIDNNIDIDLDEFEELIKYTQGKKR